MYRQRFVLHIVGGRWVLVCLCCVFRSVGVDLRMSLYCRLVLFARLWQWAIGVALEKGLLCSSLVGIVSLLRIGLYVLQNC